MKHLLHILFLLLAVAGGSSLWAQAAPEPASRPRPLLPEQQLLAGQLSQQQLEMFGIHARDKVEEFFLILRLGQAADAATMEELRQDLTGMFLQPSFQMPWNQESLPLQTWLARQQAEALPAKLTVIQKGAWKPILGGFEGKMEVTAPAGSTGYWSKKRTADVYLTRVVKTFGSEQVTTWEVRLGLFR